MDHPSLIIFYDGSCGFCNRTVAFVLKNNSDGNIYFAALQSDFTKELFLQKGWEQPDMNTFYFLENGKLRERSNAALHVLKYLKFPFRLMLCALVIPRFVRDAVYNIIARRRQHISPHYCYVPEKEERARFITD